MKRSEININETWDISNIFESREVYYKKVEEYKSLIDSFVEKYKGNINNLDTVLDSLSDVIKIYEIESKIYSYSSLPVETDRTDDELMEIYLNFTNIYAKYSSKLSFYTDELLELDNEILEKVKENSEYKVFIEELLKVKEHRLSKETEEVLSKLSNTFNFPYKLYNDTKGRDIDFPKFKVNDKEYDLSYNLYEGKYEYDKDVDIRRKAFEVFSNTIRKYENTTASAYNAQVQKEVSLANIRGYEDVFEYLLESQKVSKDLYNRQIDTIMDELSKHMRRYANILKKVHKLDEIRYSDLKIEVDPNYSLDIDFDKAKEYVLDGLSILGDDYSKILNDAFNNRWIDYANNEGKSTGAFCSSPYGTPSFICMTFNNKMSDVMTLAHELGHAGHFNLAHQNQNILNARSSMYFVEAPSTTNELIIENYLLDLAEKNNDLRMKRWILSQMVSKTYYHNFVTHLLEAYYQREVYRKANNGEQMNASKLNNIFNETLKKFWKDDVILDEGSELTWMRQPHYYMGLYPYTYSAGLTIGTQVALAIKEEGKEKADKWKEVLKLGGSKSPKELAQAAGVDISTDKPLKDTIEYIGSLIEEIEDISIELGEM